MKRAASTPRLRRLNRSSLTTLRYQLEDALFERIEGGEWQPTDVLPAEADLCETYGVSWTVVRQALDGLERAGMIRRVRGAGGFVCERRVTTRLVQDQGGFQAHTTAPALAVNTEVMGKDIVPAPDRVAHSLQISPEEEVLRLDRLRSVEGKPVLMATAYVPLGRIPCGIVDEDFRSQSLVDVLRRCCGLEPGSRTRVIEAVLARPP
jgi:GntR family transcriptional regulator